MSDSQQLLADYVATGSDTAFRELVSRYIDLVYSAAVRLVNGDTHRAEDVTQTVFADLARMSRTLSPHVMLGGWLHRHTCFVASKLMRGERRRHKREQQAVEMNSVEEHSNLEAVAPILDDAINQLGSDDRQAILLRFFEQRDFRSVGEALGSGEEAARKRVSRALDKLHLVLASRGVALSAGALATGLGGQAVTAAPIGLAAGVATAALASAATGGTAALTFLQFMSMTKVKIAVIGAVVAAGVAIPWAIHHRGQDELNEAKASLRQQGEQIERLLAENQRLSNLAARVNSPPPATNAQLPELLKLRGEVARLRQQAATAAAAALKAEKTSTLGGLTSQNPEVAKLIRDQQKMGMGMIYKDFVKRAELPKEQAEKLNDLLADDVMENIDHTTAVLRDGKSREAMEALFAAQEAVLAGKVQALLGPEEFARYQDFTRNLPSHLTAEQFKAMMSAEKPLTDAQVKQLYALVQEETQAALANAGLSPDYQAVPILNFRNIASEEEAERNLKRMDDVYARVVARANGFLGPEQIQKFEEFREKAISNSRAALVMNRKMMAPLSK
jgi:RNA polymerase sigma factor (sigma-70 family)